MNDYFIYFDGKFTRQSEAVIPVLSASAQFGLNVFEGIRAYKEDAFYIFRLEDHLERLQRSIDKIGFSATVLSTQNFLDILEELIVLNGITSDFSIRYTYLVSEVDSWASTKEPVFFIAPLVKPRRSSKSCSTAAVTDVRRLNSHAMDAKIKCGANYINGRYALQEARSKGADFPVLPDMYGHITESSGACIFLVKGGVVMTPSLSCDILESITRDTVIKILRANNIAVEERLITTMQFADSDEIFLCGSAAEITPIKVVSAPESGIGKLTELVFFEYQRAITAQAYSEHRWTTRLDVSGS